MSPSDFRALARQAQAAVSGGVTRNAAL
jgi:hypothetical protein